MKVQFMHISPKLRAAARNHPIFQMLIESEFQLVFSHLELKEFEAGELVFNEGDQALNCYFILFGDVNIFRDLKEESAIQLATLSNGQTFGEMSLIDHKERSASCKAGAQGATLLSLSKSTFEELFIAHSPLAYKVLDYVVRDLSMRLRGATRHLRKAKNSPNMQQRKHHSIKAAKLIEGDQYTDSDIYSIEVIHTDFERSLQYQKNN